MMQQTEGPREVKFHESANRHNLIMGGEREWVLLSALVCVILVMLIQTWWSTFLGISLWFLSVGVLKRMGKVDPIMSKVMMRHFRYRDYYAGQSGIDRAARQTPKAW